MNHILIILFFIIIFLIINSYIIYPILVQLLSLFVSHKKYDETTFHPVSILISAYNEEKVIESRVMNLLNQDYDLNKIEILIGSDCSDDRTNDILIGLSKKISNLQIFLFNERRGKGAVLNDLVSHARNEILIFTDANTTFAKDAIKKLTIHFNDSKIGGVSGKLILIEDRLSFYDGVEEQKYWNYENFIKKSEGNLGILIGANGGIFAIRKELYANIPIDKPVTDDFFISIAVLKKGYKFVYEADALATESIAKDLEIEFKRKVRFAATNFQTISFFKSLLLNKNILLSYALWSHKILRWFVPILLLMLFILNMILINYSPILTYIFYIQILFYSLAFLGYVLLKLKIRIIPLTLSFYFLMSNYALLLGLLNFLKKKHSLKWQSTPR